MSHNKLKVGTSEPDRTSSMTVNVADLNDVSGTPTTSQYLKYNGSSWEAVTVSATAGIEFMFIGRGESDAYSNSPHGSGAFTSSSDLYVYDTSPTNAITGATITSTNDWIESVTLPAGTYIVSGQTLLEFSSSGYAMFAFFDTSNNRLSQSGVVGTSRSTYNGAGDLAYSVIVLAAQTSIKLRLEATSGTIDTGANQGNTPANHGIIIIEKLA